MMDNKEVPYTPIIALSGDEGDKIKNMNSNKIFDEIVQKPITVYQLKRILNKWLLSESQIYN